MRRAEIFAGSVAVLVAGVCALPATSAARAVGVDLPIGGTVVNPCNGESVTFSGLDHMITNLVTDGAGGSHLTQNDNIHVTGAGDQGNSYEANEADSFSQNVTAASEITVGSSFTLISKGAAPNFSVHELYHETINPDGTITTSVGSFTTTCTG